MSIYSKAVNSPDRPQPKALRGFTDINRYWDKQQGVFAAKILPGEYYVSKEGELIVTVLGSCISACIRDPKNGIGGMNHFMLPLQHDIAAHTLGSKVSESARYGNWAMEKLINDILKNGGDRRNLEIKIFGGGKVLDSMQKIEIGLQNIEFVKRFIKEEGFRLAAEDVGGLYPRKVLYFSDTGSVKVRKLKSTRNNVLVEREKSYAHEIDKSSPAGEIELFD